MLACFYTCFSCPGAVIAPTHMCLLGRSASVAGATVHTLACVFTLALCSSSSSTRLRRSATASPSPSRAAPTPCRSRPRWSGWWGGGRGRAQGEGLGRQLLVQLLVSSGRGLYVAFGQAQAYLLVTAAIPRACPSGPPCPVTPGHQAPPFLSGSGAHQAPGGLLNRHLPHLLPGQGLCLHLQAAGGWVLLARAGLRKERGRAV